MEQLKNYIQLHLNILLFSLTGIFSKLASIQYNKNGLQAPLLYLFAFLMLANCGVYALAWQKIIKKFDLNIGYANRSVYLLWSQVWAVSIFGEKLSVRNVIGVLIVLLGVIVVSLSAEKKETGSGQKTDVASTGEKQN